MKKAVLFTIILIFCILSVNAATVSHSASEVNPGSFATGDYYYDGNVGIGTTSPSGKLEVAQTSSASPLLISSTGIHHSGLVIDNAGVGARTYRISTTRNDTPTYGSGKFVISDIDGVAYSDTGSARLVIDSSGNVGIGTTSPESLLHLVGTTPRIALFDSVGGVDRFGISANDDTLKVGVDDNNDGSWNRDIATFDDSGETYFHGNVGIGTTGPGTKLQVNGSVIFGTGISIDDFTIRDSVNPAVVDMDSPSDSYIRFNRNNDAKWSIGNDATNYEFKISEGNSLGTYDRLTILQGGNVGIGTVTPDSSLEVNGTFRVKMLLQFSATGGSITQDGDYTVHTFTTFGTFTVNGTTNVEYLVVAGGGGGGSNGGGGAGGLVIGTKSVSTGEYTVTVGSGGVAATAGSDSIFDTITAVKGGMGGGTGGDLNGGSGGGGGGYTGTTGGTATVGQGNNGGTGNPASPTYYCGAGGGGRGAVGSNGGSNVAGDGGSGVTSSISGALTYYAGGGGGRCVGSWPDTGVGGIGGGGDSNSAGTANTGGGGGATAAGGSGVVIIRYLTGPVNSIDINSEGNVGIGTTSPNAKLDVNGLTKVWNTDSPGTCSTTVEGSIYYDASLNEPCFCDGSIWKQFDGGGNC